MGKTFILSDGTSTNSYGIKIDMHGLQTARFSSNPVMLYNHRSDYIIGKWENIRFEENRLLADANFDMEDSLGKEISRKVEKGYLKGCSVGIHIKKMSDTDEGLVATEVEVLEASIVAVPSDANAVSLYDENSKPTTIETVKLNFNCNYNKNQMDKKMELTAKTLESLGLDDSATAKIIELAVVAKDTKITELEGKVSAFEKQKVNDLINQAIADKKISADEKSTYIGLAEKDYAGVKKILDKMQGVSPVSGQLKQQGVSSKYEGKTWDELDRAGLLASLKAEAPELYNQLYKNKFNIQ